MKSADRSIPCALALLCAAGLGCPTVEVGPGEDGGADGSADGGADGSADGDLDDGRVDGDRDSGPVVGDVLIYAHSRDILFTFSPDSLTVATVGPFTLPDGEPAPYMLDLAINEAGEVYTSSDTSLFRVVPDTARATLVGEFGLADEQLFALSFLAPGELIDDMEVLVGATSEGDYYSVDPATARTVFLGSYPEPWLSSGDIVSVAGLGTYATVKRGDRPDDADVLVQMSFAADGSSSVEVLGHVEQGGRRFSQIFGIGYWGRSIYGFTNAGELVEIHRETGAGTLVSEETGTDHFWGAGVTTQAPVLY